jgi:hypothetical protein
MQDKWFSNPTQVAWVCRALTQCRAISHKTEYREAKGWRLAAICERLRKEFGWPIVTEYRGPEHIAYYSLQPGTDPLALNYPPSARWVLSELREGAA